MISNIEGLRDLSGPDSFHFQSFGENRTIQSAEYYNTSRSIPL